MHMSFWWGSDLGDLLFKGVTVQGAVAMVTACLVFTLIAVVYEGLRVLEAKMRNEHKCRSWRKAHQTLPADDTSNLLHQDPNTPGPSRNSQTYRAEETTAFQSRCLRMLKQVLMYTTNTTANYFIMLVIMLYNGYLAVAILIGSMIGYYLCGHISIRYNMEAVRERSMVRTVCAPDCEQICDGSTPPLLQGRGASENTLYSNEGHSNPTGSDAATTTVTVEPCGSQKPCKKSAKCCCDQASTPCCKQKQKNKAEQSNLEQKQSEETKEHCCKKENASDRDLNKECAGIESKGVEDLGGELEKEGKDCCHKNEGMSDSLKDEESVNV